MDQPDSARSSGRRSALYRHRLVLIAAGLVLVAGLLAGIVAGAGDDTAPGAAPPPDTAPTPAPPATAPAAPTAKVCANAKALAGPATAPAGAITVATTQNLNELSKASPAGSTFWLQPGTHTLGTGPFSQVIPKEGNTYVGAPGAVLDGQRVNRYAFTGYVTGVTIKNLTIQTSAPRGRTTTKGW